ncbi:MAG: glycosyltransferase family 4 protein [Nitrospirae bacterium]|nr:glycosyltransferase family 4 protein [Nitrospirota bacterium]
MHSKIKVVHIITKLELGGAQENTLYTVSHLDKKKFIPVLITGTEGLLVDDAKRLGIEAHFLPSLVREINPVKDITALLDIRRLLLKIKRSSQSPIIVHTHSSKAGIIGRWAAFFAGIPVVIHTYHGYGFNDYQSISKRRLFILLERLTARITTRFIAVSKNNIEKGIDAKIFKRDDVELIRSGIDISEFSDIKINKAKKKKELQVDFDKPLVGMIACFKPQKAPLDFIKAAHLVHQKMPDVRFIVAGDGELRPSMEELINSLGLKDKIKLLGFRRDIPEIMKCLDVFVLTSLWEGLPRVILQALAAGVPVVATEVDGSSEVVKNGINGFLIKPGDAEGIAEKIMYILQEIKDFKFQISDSKSILDEFDINLMVRQQEKLYMGLIQKQ